VEHVAGRVLPAWGGGEGRWWRWRGCGRHKGGSVTAAAVSVAEGGSRRCRSRHLSKHRPAAGKHGIKGGAWQQQRASGTESAERRGYRAASPATPPGWGTSEPTFSARDAQFLGNGHRTWWKVSSKYREHSLSPFTEGRVVQHAQGVFTDTPRACFIACLGRVTPARLPKHGACFRRV